MAKFLKVTSAGSTKEFILNFHWVSGIRRNDDGGSVIFMKKIFHVDGNEVLQFNAMEDFEYFEKHLCEINSEEN